MYYDNIFDKLLQRFAITYVVAVLVTNPTPDKSTTMKRKYVIN